jgi:hypothetical protein
MPKDTKKTAKQKPIYNHKKNKHKKNKPKSGFYSLFKLVRFLVIFLRLYEQLRKSIEYFCSFLE